MEYFLSGLIAYLFGSINFALIVSRRIYKQDIRNFGSGSAGMTNILRTYGKTAAAAVFAGDFLKGVIAVLAARYLTALINPDSAAVCAYVAAFFVVLGHLLPIYFKFKGGKGVVTSAAVIFMLEPAIFPILVVLFLIIAFSTRIVSVSSMTIALLYPIITFLYLHYKNLPFIGETVFAALIGILLVYMHRSNIQRLIKGEEPRFGKKKKNDKSK